MSDSGAPELDAFLRAIAELAEKYGVARYQAGFRKGLTAHQRLLQEASGPPPVPFDAKKRSPVGRGQEHATPVHHVEWPYARAK